MTFNSVFRIFNLPKSKFLSLYHFDLSQKGQANVREGYLSDGWEQPRWLNHIALRAREPEKVAEFYSKIIELKGVEEAGEAGSMMLTDGKVRLIIRRCHNGFYRTIRQGFDHIGFKVDSIEQTTNELAELATVEDLGSPIKRHLSREKSIPTVRGVSCSPSVVRIGVGETNQ